jgi:hypothetical protein
LRPNRKRCNSILDVRWIGEMKMRFAPESGGSQPIQQRKLVNMATVSALLPANRMFRLSTIPLFPKQVAPTRICG